MHFGNWGDNASGQSSSEMHGWEAFVLASSYVYSWWKTSPPRTSTRIWMFDYNVITRIPWNYPDSSIPMQSLPQSSNNIWNWCFLMSSNPQSSVQPLKLFTRTLWCSVRQLDPLEHENFRKNPQYPWRWNESTQFTLDPWFPINILESNQLPI